jgi:hypothetical protein
MTGIDALISEKERQAQQLRAALSSVEVDLQALYRTRAIMRGETDSEAAAMRSSRGQASIADLVESILRVAGELHCDDLVKRLAEIGVEVNKQTVSATLTRYIARKKRFKRVGPNRFALLKEGEETDVK